MQASTRIVEKKRTVCEDKSNTVPNKGGPGDGQGKPDGAGQGKEGIGGS